MSSTDGPNGAAAKGRARRRLTVVLVPAGSGKTRTLKVSYAWLRALAAAGTLALAVGAATTASWWSLYQRATRASDLAQQVDSLTASQPAVHELAARFVEMERQLEQFRLLFGHVEPPDVRLWQLSSAPAAGASAGSEDDEAETAPSAWPLSAPGFVTQSLLEGDDGDHPGIDIAVPTDSYIRAAGAGYVVEAGQDSVYGFFVRIDHGDGFQSVYGHASMLTVETGARVRRGEVVAMSGSTGRSTAAHLHFEVLRNGRAVDPLTFVSPP